MWKKTGEIQKKKTVLVFGAFDGLHDGHRFFLREARKLGERLVVCVADDRVIQELKNHASKYLIGERMNALRKSGHADKVVAGDAELNRWSAIEKYRPEIVALGYDQGRLKKKLERYIVEHDLPTELIVLPPHKPDTLHSSLLL